MWKKIKGFENYSINENGEVRNDSKNSIKKSYFNKKNGYYYIDLCKCDKSYKRSIHRLLAEAYIPNLNNKPTVDHIDGDRKNNSLNNLRWATYSEQNSRFKSIGVRSENIIVEKFKEERKKRGGGHIAWLECIETIEFNSITDCAKYFDVTISNISLMLEKGTIGQRGVTRGYKFMYKNSERKLFHKRVTTIETN